MRSSLRQRDFAELKFDEASCCCSSENDFILLVDFAGHECNFYVADRNGNRCAASAGDFEGGSEIGI